MITYTRKAKFQDTNNGWFSHINGHLTFSTTRQFHNVYWHLRCYFRYLRNSFCATGTIIANRYSVLTISFSPFPHPTVDTFLVPPRSAMTGKTTRMSSTATANSFCFVFYSPTRPFLLNLKHFKILQNLIILYFLKTSPLCVRWSSWNVLNCTHTNCLLSRS